MTWLLANLGSPRTRINTVGRFAFSLLTLIAIVIAVAWFFVARHEPEGSGPYTTGVFLGSLFAVVTVTALLFTSKHVRMLERLEVRAELKQAAVALIFDSEGHLLVRLQSEDGRSSWPDYWLPPGGLNAGLLPETALRQLNTLVLKREWPNGIMVASTKPSAAYRRINKKATQTPVQVHAYWFRWTEDQPFVAVGELPDDINLRVATVGQLPEPIPEYYVELIEYFDSIKKGKELAKPLKCWSLHDTELLRLALRNGKA